MFYLSEKQVLSPSASSFPTGFIASHNSACQREHNHSKTFLIRAATGVPFVPVFSSGQFVSIRGTTSAPRAFSPCKLPLNRPLEPDTVHAAAHHFTTGLYQKSVDADWIVTRIFNQTFSIPCKTVYIDPSWNLLGGRLNHPFETEKFRRRGTRLKDLKKSESLLFLWKSRNDLSLKLFREATGSRTITSDRNNRLWNNSSLSFRARRYDITG